MLRRRENRLQGLLGEVQLVFTDYEALPDYSRVQHNDNVIKHRRKRRRSGFQHQQVAYWNNMQVPYVLFLSSQI